METHSLYGFDDPIDSWTHLLGAIAVLLFVIKLFKHGGVGRKHPVPILIYGFSSIFLLSMSGVYHLLPRDSDARYLLRILDHAGIFLQIAGTLIAVHMILFSGLMKWGVILVASIIALLGIIFGTIYFNELPVYMTHSIYIAFGWLGVITVAGIRTLHTNLSIKYLVYGGVAYTIGAVLDMFETPVLIPGYLGAHQLFHFSVLLGIFLLWRFILESVRIVERIPSEKIVASDLLQ